MAIKYLLGTHMIGDSEKDPHNVKYDTAEDVEAILAAFQKRGGTDIDTARLYSPLAGGSSEQRLGAAKASTRFTVHTKVQSGKPGNHEAAKLKESIDLSLDALKTDTVETMFLHIPDRQTPFAETAKAMDEGLKNGKFKRWGISNYTAAELQEFLDICEKEGYAKPSVYQGHYNAVVRGGEKELFPLLRKHGMSFYAYSPAAGGLLADHSATSSRWSEQNPIGQMYNSKYAAVKEDITVITRDAKDHKITGHEAALRWTAFHSALDAKSDDGLIFGVSKLSQLESTMDALEAGPLPQDLANKITALFAKVEDNAPSYHM